jgi:putative colanic acid biosynthesis acetyltransferase WcaB
LQDWKINDKNIKGRIILILFRLAHIATVSKVLFILWIPYLVFYRVFVEWFLGTELPYKLKIGKNFLLYHGQALVINDGTVIGSNCTIRHCTTIGNKKNKNGTFTNSPVIGNNVELGSNVCVIGPIIIGDNVVIGAGSIVVKDVPPNCIIAGNPAKVIAKNLTHLERELVI